MKRRNYVKTLGTLGVFTTAIGVSSAESNRSITGVISKTRIESNNRLNDLYEQPFFTLTETTTNELGNRFLNYALNSPSHRVDETLITEGKNGEKRFTDGIEIYLTRLNRDQFQKHLKQTIMNQDITTQSSEENVAILSSDIQSVDEYEQRLNDLRREAEKEAEKQIQESLNSRGDA